MTRVTRTLSFLAATALAFSPLPPAAQARTVMASAGRPQFFADWSCFWLENSSMTNGCARTVRLETSLPVDAGGWWTVRVSAQGATTANNVCCSASSTDANAVPVSAPGAQCLRVFGTPDVIPSQAVFVPAGGGLFVSCNVQPNGRVNTINY